MRRRRLLALAAAGLRRSRRGPRTGYFRRVELDFAGTLAFLGSGAPGFVLAAVRGGETAFAGFGETPTGSGKAPTADTLMRIGSISKVFCGATLASMLANHEIALTDRLQDRLGEG